MRRGEIWWAFLADPVGSGPGFRRPVLIIQSDDFTRSRIGTVIVAPLTSNTARGAAPGNLLLRPSQSGLSKDSVVNVSQLLTVDKLILTERVKKIAARLMADVDSGLRLVLALQNT